MEKARRHFGALGHDVPQHVNIADAVLDLVIRSPPSQVWIFRCDANYRMFLHAHRSSKCLHVNIANAVLHLVICSPLSQA